ncbi:hypothetical protein N0V93_007887 [Gnomoniopsis smithogilvyi]|uniref:Uncharacterized protein n=1 Tax=Gnomoniopsis smithogilvyi TaxID=1191159 RepID=A0A9W8YLY0_9PEZI|nr:hypothetical protein N0V93_007887 [Gnomoniopsis smithogilvyi]
MCFPSLARASAQLAWLTGILSLAYTAHASQTLNTTASGTDLQTWWHDNGEINFDTPVQEGNVRQSHIYSTWVGSNVASTNQTFYQSFVYETIPRNGQGNILVPGDLSSLTNASDTVTIEADIWITMAWTSFLYSTESVVKISRAGNGSTASNVVIRPSNLKLDVTDDGEGNVYVTVPYRAEGYRFSVEFQDTLYSYRDDCGSTECDFVQDWHPDGPNYFANFTDANPVMGVEPHDSLLIFASPFPAADFVPEQTANETYVVWPGLVPDLSSINNTVVYFPPGTYWMTGTNHLVLPPSVNWVHLDAGAYVKGAIEFTTESATMKATGHGVLSGEQYVYQANTASGYTNNQSNIDGLRMWSGYSCSDIQQTFVLQGVTTNAPPFNTVDFTGDIDSMSVYQRDYKLVGAYFGQTDGTTLYSGSDVADTFYHSGDDTIKTYGSNITVRDVVVWKGKTAPTIQFGWASRNISNITVDGIDIIHMKYNSNMSHPSIIGANQIYNIPETQTDTADLSSKIRDVYFGNIRAEGISGNLMRIVPLSNFENITVENVSIEQFGPASTGIHQSQLPTWTNVDGKEVRIAGFTVTNFSVAGVQVAEVFSNYGANALGALNIAPVLLAIGSVEVTLPAFMS